MKYLIIFLLLVAVVGLIGWRFRRQIAIARQVWKMLAQVRNMNRQPGAAPQPKNIPVGKLVRCEKCGTWIPKDTALTFGSNTYFCSAQCMEKSVEF